MFVLSVPGTAQSHNIILDSLAAAFVLLHMEERPARRPAIPVRVHYERLKEIVLQHMRLRTPEQLHRHLVIDSCDWDSRSLETRIKFHLQATDDLKEPHLCLGTLFRFDTHPSNKNISNRNETEGSEFVTLY